MILILTLAITSNAQALIMPVRAEAGVQIETGIVDVKTNMNTEVKSDADFEVYAKSIVSTERAIEKVSIKDKQMNVGYTQTVKLFGFIPMTADNEAQVTFSNNANGKLVSSVDIDQPWWSFMARTGVSSMESKLKSAIDTKVSTEEVVQAFVYAKALEAVKTTVNSQTSVK
ncbi:MAG: hypothetical protein RJB39_549 [Candidatus Parcubacteria bacterium]|jgi:hypothetical protein